MEGTEHLPPDCELKLGQVYRVLPILNSAAMISTAQTAGGVKEDQSGHYKATT